MTTATTTSNDTPPLATRREWIGLGVLALACLLYVMDLTVLHLAVPKLSAALQPSSAQLLWIIDIYGFLVAGALVTMGTLGDRIGRRRLLMIGAGAFGLASLLAAFSVSAEMLIVARALLGIAGATLAPSTLSLIFHMFADPRQRRIAIGVWIGAFSAGSAVGPVLGGVMLEFFWWGSVFLLALPVMAALLILGMLIFAHSWFVFATAAMKAGHFLAAGLQLLNDLLLVIILLELFRTVVRFLQTEILALEPYLSVGIIACTRRILTASAELSHLPEVTNDQFYRYLMDVGVNVGVIIVLVLAVSLVRKHPALPGSTQAAGMAPVDIG
jgi:MFS family permease